MVTSGENVALSGLALISESSGDGSVEGVDLWGYWGLCAVVRVNLVMHLNVVEGWEACRFLSVRLLGREVAVKKYEIVFSAAAICARSGTCPLC